MSLQIAEFAQLPVGIKHGVGGKLGNRLYVGLGVSESSFSITT